MSNTMQELDEKLSMLEENPFGVRFDPIDTLLETLHHSSEEIRARGARLSGSFPTEEFIEPLFRLAAEDPKLGVRRAAVEALGAFLHHGQMVDYHRSGKDEKDPEQLDPPQGISPVQFRAIRDFMGELAQQEDWPDALRATALPFYAELEPEAAETLIDRFYRSGREEQMRGALEAIGRLPSGDWTSLLKKEVSRETYDERRLAAIDAVGVHDVYETGPELVGILERAPRDEFRQAAAEALSVISWGEAPRHLEEFTEDEDEQVRQYAKEGMIRWAHRREREEQDPF